MGWVTDCAVPSLSSTPSTVMASSNSPPPPVVVTFDGVLILRSIGSPVQNKMELAMGVAVGSATQVSMFVVPVAVLSGWAMVSLRCVCTVYTRDCSEPVTGISCCCCFRYKGGCMVGGKGVAGGTHNGAAGFFLSPLTAWHGQHRDWPQGSSILEGASFFFNTLKEGSAALFRDKNEGNHRRRGGGRGPLLCDHGLELLYWQKC